MRIWTLLSPIVLCVNPDLDGNRSRIEHARGCQRSVPLELMDDMDEDRSSPDPRYGPWKFIHEISVQDLQTHPIWLWCMTLSLPDEDDGPLGGDETSMRPLLNSRNVEPGMFQPLILLRVKGTDYFAHGLYDHDSRKLVSIGIEEKSPDDITTLTRVGGLRVPVGWTAPLAFVAVPTIAGRSDVEFRCSSLDKDEAEMV